MDKATNAIRRSSVRLKSISSGHSDLNLVVSQLRDVKSTAKAYIAAQNTAAHDLLRWSHSNEMKAIQDTFMQFYELNALWTDVQKEFIGHFKKFIHQFEMILEGEQLLDQVRNNVSVCERQESKIRKNIKTAVRKSNSEEVRQLEMKLAQAERSKELAQLEVMDRVKENEAIKLIRIKEGLLKLSEAYLDLSIKCQIINEAHRDVAYLLPDVQDKNIHEIQYTGTSAAEQTVANAKERVSRQGRRSLPVLPSAPLADLGDLPPPYSPFLSVPHHGRRSLQAHSSGTTPRRHSALRHSLPGRNPFEDDGDGDSLLSQAADVR